METIDEIGSSKKLMMNTVKNSSSKSSKNSEVSFFGNENVFQSSDMDSSSDSHISQIEI
jgi:hypothetical protein